jgi:WD40 repeat protein
MGHSKAVHDVTFNNDGGEFLSAAFDRQMKLWDSETGTSSPSSSLSSPTLSTFSRHVREIEGCLMRQKLTKEEQCNRTMQAGVLER